MDPGENGRAAQSPIWSKLSCVWILNEGCLGLWLEPEKCGSAFLLWQIIVTI